jgi:hypothetical protein
MTRSPFRTRRIVVLQSEEQGQRAAHHALVLGQQHPDHRRSLLLDPTCSSDTAAS